MTCCAGRDSLSLPKRPFEFCPIPLIWSSLRKSSDLEFAAQVHELTIPSVHVTGRADAIVPRRDSLLLADRFADPLIIGHPGRHVIPADTTVTAPIAGFLAGFARDAGAASSTPACTA